MKYTGVKITACALAAAVVISGSGITAYAKDLSSLLPAAGVDLALDEGTTLASVKDEVDSKKGTSSPSGNSTASGNAAARSVKESSSGSKNGKAILSVGEAITDEEVSSAVSDNKAEDSKKGRAVAESIKESVSHNEIKNSSVSGNTVSGGDLVNNTDSKGLVVPVTLIPSSQKIQQEMKEDFTNLVIAKVNDYVNIRNLPGEEGEVVGKLYDKSVGEYISEDNGWYQISSGNVTGYVKAEYCVTGESAQEMALQVGTRIATVNTTTLKVRTEPNTESSVLGLIPNEDQLVVSEETDGWVKVNIEEGDGYVSTDYVKISTEFVKAESKAEEETRLRKEEEARKSAQQAAARAAAADNKTNNSKKSSNAASGSSNSGVKASGSGTGSSVADYALQFVGNPYVYGGTSLTNGADCSGFVMSVYKKFGVSLPHSSAADRNVGYNVGSLANAQPGDIVCYSGHVAIYIGNGQIVHASTAKTGIKVSNANYRTPLAVRRIF